jgi:hypothetical protein
MNKNHELHMHCVLKYREDFYIVDRFHGNQCTAGWEAHMNFADKSACLTADNIWNEVVTNHKSGNVENAAPLHLDIPCKG